MPVLVQRRRSTVELSAAPALRIAAKRGHGSAKRCKGGAKQRSAKKSGAKAGRGDAQA